MQNTVKLLKKKMKHSLCSVTTQTKRKKNIKITCKAFLQHVCVKVFQVLLKIMTLDNISAHLVFNSCLLSYFVNPNNLHYSCFKNSILPTPYHFFCIHLFSRDLAYFLLILSLDSINLYRINEKHLHSDQEKIAQELIPIETFNLLFWCSLSLV